MTTSPARAVAITPSSDDEAQPELLELVGDRRKRPLDASSPRRVRAPRGVFHCPIVVTRPSPPVSFTEAKPILVRASARVNLMGDAQQGSSSITIQRAGDRLEPGRVALSTSSATAPTSRPTLVVVATGRQNNRPTQRGPGRLGRPQPAKHARNVVVSSGQFDSLVK